MALEKQMDLFQEGGMIDEGGTTDPVSEMMCLQAL